MQVVASWYMSPLKKHLLLLAAKWFVMRSSEIVVACVLLAYYKKICSLVNKRDDYVTDQIHNVFV